MRERNNDTPPRRSSPSRSRDRDGNESSMSKQRDVSNRSGRSPLQADGHDVLRTFREQNVDGIRRECGYLDELERRRSDGFPNEGRREEAKGRNDEHCFQEDAFPGEQYRNRSYQTLVLSAEEPCWRHGAEPFRATSPDPKPSIFVTSRDNKYYPSHEGNVRRSDETDQLESNSRGCSDSSRHRLKPTEQIEANVVAKKGEHYSEDIRERDNTCLQESSPLSQVGSSGANFQEESSRTLSLNTQCCIGVKDSDRVDERRPDYGGNRCASMVLQTGHLDDYVDRNSPRDQQGKSSQDLSCKDHDSTALSRRGKEVVDESRKCYQTVTEFPSVEHDVNNMARETDLLMQARGSLSNSYVHGSYLVDVDAADTHLEFCTKERMTDQYGLVKEHSPFIELGSNLVKKRHGEAYHYRNSRDRERNTVYLDNKLQPRRKDYQYGVDGRGYLDSSGPDVVVHRDNKTPQSIIVCLNKEREAYLDNERNDAHTDERRQELRNEYHLNKEREAYLDNERNAVNTDERRQELRNEYHFGNDGRMRSDVHGEEVLVDRDGRIVQIQEVCLNKEREAYLDNERKADYCDDKRLRNEYHFDNDGRMHFDVHEVDTVVDRDGRVVQLPRVGLNKRKAADSDNGRENVYLHHRSQQLNRDYDAGTDARIYHDANRLDSVVDREDTRGVRYRRVSLNNRKEAISPYESQQRLKEDERNSYGMMHPDVYKSDILVDREDYSGLKYRGVSLNDRKEAYLQCESQQLLNDRETTCYGTMHPDVNTSDILVDRKSARALERRGSSFDDRKESYLDNERRESYLDNERKDAYLRYESQRVKRDYDYGTDDRIYRNVNSSDIIVDHGDAKALERRSLSFNDGNKAYFGNESKVVYQHHQSQQLKNDYNSGIYAYPYEMMHLDVCRSSAGKQDEEALRSGRYVFDDRSQVYMDDEYLPLHTGGHVKVHGNTRYPDRRQNVYHSKDEILLQRDEYCLRDDVGEVTHEYIADDYKSYGDVKQSRISYEKPDNGRFRDNAVGYDYRGKVGKYAGEGGTSSDQSRYLVDERNSGNENHASIQRPRVSVKERLGGRVEESRVHVKNRIQLPVRNPKRKGKYHKKNQRTIS